MSNTNVGAKEGAVRLAIAVWLFVVTTTYCILRADAVALLIWGAVVVVSALLIKSVLTRHCPCHERLGVDTT